MESKKTFTKAMLQEECGVIEVNNFYFVRDVYKKKANRRVVTQTMPTLMIQKCYDKKTNTYKPSYIGLTVSLYNYKTGKYVNMSFAKLRMIWELGEVPMGMVIDHIDTNPLNNDLDNLRLLTERENQVNRKIWKKFESMDLIEGKSYAQIKEMIEERIRIANKNS